MRMPIERHQIKNEKNLKMKGTTTAKKKKINAIKSMDDSVSETISFVIKGHLTPMKTSALTKKPTVRKSNVKIISKNKVVDNSLKKLRLAKKVTANEVKSDLCKKSISSKKSNKKVVPDMNVKQNKAEIKKLPVVRKSKKKLLDVMNGAAALLQDEQEENASKSLATNHTTNKVNKNETFDKSAKRSTKETKKPIKDKIETVELKSEKNVSRRRKSPLKFDADEKIKEKSSDVKKIKSEEQAASKINSVIKNQDKDKTIEKVKPGLTTPKKKVISVERKKPKKAVTKQALKNKLIKQEMKLLKIKMPPKKLLNLKKRKKIKVEESTDEASTSDEITLDELRQDTSDRKVKVESEVASPKVEPKVESVNRKVQNRKKPLVKPKIALPRKGAVVQDKNKTKRKEDPRARKMKLYSFWNSPKRHRVASLNALAKVHCLYENETRGAILDAEASKGIAEKKVKVVKEEDDEDDEEEEEVVASTRILRSGPGRQGVGKHWEMHDEAFSSSEENESSVESPEIKPKQEKVKVAAPPPVKKRTYTKRKRNHCELIMDLKDMVVRKRMASLNASAILAASYSPEKRTPRSPKSDTTVSDDSDESFSLDTPKCYEDDVKKEDDRKVIEVSASPNKKVSVILNQDTDVTITGVYVNSTTRSTHHEGYCSIAGMQYRISAKSHTQTASTTVASETIMQSAAANIGPENITTAESSVQPNKSYTPLSALSSMQPPGQHEVPLAPPPHIAPQHHVIPLSATQHVVHHNSPISRRHGCVSAFSAPPGAYGPPPPAHHHPVSPNDPGYIHGYYQPAGPLISVPPHAHPQPTLGKVDHLSEVSSSPTPPPTHQPRPQSSTTDSLDSDVIITSTTTAKESLSHQQQPPPPPQPYRYSQYHPHSYPYGYHPQYYPAPPPAPSYHHDLCYPPNPYLHHKAYPPPTYRRHLTAPAGTPYYQANPPDLYHPPHSASNQQSQQVVTANPAVSSSYQPTPSGPPPTIMESYPPPPPPPTLVEPYPPPHYYPGYGPAPPPSCYTHSPPTRSLPYLNAAYQSCPCPMQSCPKNVHTGPLTGDSKRSSHISSISKDSLPLPPVALALPLEPVSATGPPSPARGSAGMPPPPSPAGAVYQPPPMSKQEAIELIEDCKPMEKRRKARVGKSMVRNNIAANFPENTMLLMCHAPCVTNVKREIESPEAQKQCVEAAIKTKPDSPQTAPDNNNAKQIATNLDIPNGLKGPNEDLVNLKTEEEKELENSSSEELLPCQKTVAENVKVKNMKRKLSTTTTEAEKADEDLTSAEKKLKMNGSYKDLIKKDVPSFKINNGKRRLNINGYRALLKSSKLKFRRNRVKRKLSPVKNESNKRLKISKPLTASNLHNSKQNFKFNRNRFASANSEQSENKEVFVKSVKKIKVNSKCSFNSNKKFGPAILDNLIAKNNVDKTIEYVVTGCCENVRTNNKKLDNNFKTLEKCKNSKVDNNNKKETFKSTNLKGCENKSKVIVAKKVGACKRKSKSKSVDLPSAIISKISRRSIQLPKWSNGWTWKGEPFQAKVFLNSDETTVVRRCYPAMRHTEGDIIEPRDCVLLKAGPRKNDLPFVAKVAALWENPEDGEMMISLLWYYRPEHTEQGRQPSDEPDEVFASRHKDTNSVACIEDKCYVLTFNEYCRYRTSLRKIEEGIENIGSCVPNPEPYPRIHRQPPTKVQTSPDLVFFCRRVYDFRQKRIAKNPS